MAAAGLSWCGRRGDSSSAKQVLLLVCCLHLVGASRPAQGSHRQLLQEAPPPCSLQETGCASQKEVSIVEVDLIDKECVVMQNAWFDGPLATAGGARVNFLIKDSPLECCKDCFERPGCSVWTYCEREGGCLLPGVTPRELPYKGCRLVALANFHPVVNRSTAFRVMGPQVPFMSGAPIELTLPKVPNYQINSGVDLNSQYDYKCDDSPRSDVCEVAGDAYALARLCDQHPECLGFVYLPKGLDFRSNPIGILKGGKDVTRIPLSAVAVNPSTALFLKNSTVYSGSAASPDGGSSGTSSSRIVLLIALPVTLVIALAAVVAFALFAMRLRVRTRQQELEEKERQHREQQQGPGGHALHAAQHLHGLGQLPKDPNNSWPVAAAATVLSQGSELGGQQHLQQQQLQQLVELRQRPFWPAPRRSGQGSPLLRSDMAALLPSQQQHWQRARLDLDPHTVELLRRFGDDGTGERSSDASPRSTLTINAGSQSVLLGGGALTPAGSSSSPDSSLEPPGAPTLGPGGSAASSGGSPGLPTSGQQKQQQAQAPHLLAQLTQVAAAPQPPDPSWPAPAEPLAASLALQQPQQPVPFGALGPSQQQQRHLSPPQLSPVGSSVNRASSFGLLPSASWGTQASVALPVLPWSDWELQPEEIEVCRRPDGCWWELGSGAFGTVYKGLYHGLQPVAVKVLHSDTDPRVLQEFVKEVTLLKNFRDRNIVQFLGASLDGPVAMLVTEFMELGDLWRALPLKNQAGERIFAWSRRGRRVALDVARGLHYLHHKRVVHLDLKSANILLSRHGTAKICDCGFSRVLTREYVSTGTPTIGTFAWSAPEVLAGRRCTEKVDIYSYGVVLWEICTGEVPVRGNMRALHAPEDCPQEVVNLYERCTAEDPSLRPTAGDLVRAISALL